MPHQPARRRAPFTLAGCLTGARLTLPLWPGIVVFGVAYGAAAAGKGMSVAEALATSAIVYAGAAQMVGLELWRETWSLSTLVAVMTVTLFVNARMVLMGATLQPWLVGAPGWRNALGHFVLTDGSWVVAMRYREGGGRDLGVLFGAGVALWPLWLASTWAGCLTGALVSRPRAYGLDLVMPVLFTAMLVPLWRGARAARPWAVAALAALAAQRLLPGYAFIVVGGLAGCAAGALLDDPAPSDPAAHEPIADEPVGRGRRPPAR